MSIDHTNAEESQTDSRTLVLKSKTAKADKAEKAEKAPSTDSADSASDSIPETEGETAKLPIQFSDLGLKKSVVKLLSEIGYEAPSPIQAESIPPLLAGKDILGLAQTGTGKTAAFALPIISKLNAHVNQPQALILVPTRELAIQVSEAFQKYATYNKEFHVLPIYGGQDMRGQLRQLKRGVHVVVGTPGRVMDHIRRRSLVLDELTTVVLDEADEMLRMGFIDDVQWILDHTPDDKQVALFSATMPRAIKSIAQDYLHDAVEIKIASKTATVERIEQFHLIINAQQKLEALTRVLEVEDFDGVIIFVRTKLATLELAQKLEARGYSSAGLNGDMDQKQREMTIERLRKGKIDIVIATDVAARGIDVSRVSHVINYDLPYDSESYVHRIGRTGRAGRSGRALLFVTPRERRMLRMIEKATSHPIKPLQLPSHKQISDQRIEAFKSAVLSVLSLENSEDRRMQINISDYREIVDQLVLQSDASIEEIATGLLYLAQQGRPLFVQKHSVLDATKDERSRDRGDRSDREGRRRRDRGESRRFEEGGRSGRERGERGDRSGRRGREESVPMETFRIAVGRRDDASPREIVGAIANEADLDSQYIGKIKLFDDYSTVELPKGMPRELLTSLKNTRVRQRKLMIEKFYGQSNSHSRSSFSDKPPRKGPKKSGGAGAADYKKGGKKKVFAGSSNAAKRPRKEPSF